MFSNISFKKYCLSLVAIAVVVVVVVIVVVVVVVVAVVVVERALLFQLNEKNDFEVIFWQSINRLFTLVKHKGKVVLYKHIWYTVR